LYCVLHPFPTLRSSDLVGEDEVVAGGGGGGEKGEDFAAMDPASGEACFLQVLRDGLAGGPMGLDEVDGGGAAAEGFEAEGAGTRSEEHTSELQSREKLV